MNLPEFMKELNYLIAEIGEDRVNSHYSLIPSLHIIGDKEGHSYEVSSIEPQLLPGCNCWSGVVIYLERK
jgi:hypothetical protein